MRLKSLEIQGFKSFGEKTLVTFNDQITGIVGPNGCGKSNIVDAIRWVMGEQSAKHLRGQHMEDIIFSGSQSHAAGSMASVELTFTTNGAQTPPQYANLPEISIGRRLYRTGESEYLINKQPVRLKDVVDLFLGTGVGTKAYSIIEQGRVGQIIGAKPEERRGIIEEAAGISKFKARKDAALRRMESTKQNLLRLKDIIAEIERQMGTLDRQAKKAQKYKELRDELLGLELTLSSRDYLTFNTRQDELLNLIKERDAQETEMRVQVEQTENWIEEQRIELLNLESQVNASQQENFEWDNRLRLAEARLQGKKDEVSRAERDSDQTAGAIAELKHELAGIQNGFSQINQNKLFADLDFEELEESVWLKEVEYNRLQTSSQELFATIESAREAFNLAANRLSQITAQCQGMRERLQEISQKKAASEEELESLSQKFNQTQRLLNDTAEALTEVKQLKLSLGEQTGQLESDLKLEEERIRQEQEQLETLKEELLRRKSRLHSLEELEKNFEGYQEGPRAVLQRKQSGELSFDLTSVADILETNPRFEAAVSAVLGERMQYVVVPDAERGVECAQMLKVSGSGRGSFIPLSFGDSGEVIESHPPYVPADGLAGFQGSLAEFVTIRPEYAQLKKILFGDVLLVDSIANAMETWQKTRKTTVTLDGEVISQDGILTGGSIENTSKALLEKKREIKELGQIVEDLVGQVKAKSEICFDLKHKIQSLRAQLEEIKTSVHNENLKIATQERDVSHLKQQIESINHRRGQISQQIFEWTETLEKLESQIGEFSREEFELTAQRDEAAQILTDKKSEEETSRQELAVKQDQLTKEKIRLAQATQQRNFLQKEIDRLLEEKLLIHDEIVKKEEERRLLVKTRIRLEDQIDFLDQTISMILQEKTRIEATYREQKNLFDEANAQIREREVQQKRLRYDYDQIRNELNQATLGLTETRANLSRLNDQILERYQLILGEVYQNYLELPEGFDIEAESERAREMRLRLSSMGSVNLSAIEEYDELKGRFEFLEAQRLDLENSLQALEDAIQKINRTTRTRFKETFDLINEKFSYLFPKLFRGGQAYLQLTDPENILETGVDIIAEPPGKKLQSITLLSGGEKALTAVSLLFAIFLIKPSPFCLLDEVDAPLDDVNVDRYNEIIKEMSQRTQFVVITHNKRTMQMTNCLFGVTMQDPGVSQLVSVNLNG